MMRRFLISIPLAGMLFLSGCATTAGPREQNGAVLGAALGGLFGAAASYSRHNDYYHGGDGFSTGHIDSTSQWLGTGYFGTTGLKFDPGTRPALEVTLGGGEMWVYAEGYWSSE